jgi:hypothetical protein
VAAEPARPEESEPARDERHLVFTFGLLWVINNGVLDRAEYLPCVQKRKAICS